MYSYRERQLFSKAFVTMPELQDAVLHSPIHEIAVVAFSPLQHFVSLWQSFRPKPVIVTALFHSGENSIALAAGMKEAESLCLGVFVAIDFHLLLV